MTRGGRIWLWVGLPVIAGFVAYVGAENWLSRIVAFVVVVAFACGWFAMELRRRDGLRDHARNELGDDFSDEAFDVFLSKANFTGGPLAYQVDEWIAARRKAA